MEVGEALTAVTAELGVQRMRTSEGICANPTGGSQALFLRWSRVKMNSGENERGDDVHHLGSLPPKGCGTKTQQQVVK